MVEKNKNKKVNGKNIKQTLLDYNDIVSQINENTTDILRDLLKEEVKKRYNQILTEDTEDKEDDYEEEEVEDVQDPATDDVEDETLSAETEDFDDEELENADDVDGMTEDEGDEWKAFEKYKVGDNEYDFSNAEDDDVVKVYKLLKDDDQVVVKNEDGKVNIKDNETGAEYIVDTNSDEEDVLDDEDSFIDDDNSEYEIEMSDIDVDDNDELKDESMKNEQRIYEIALNEYDANLGYTDDYQKHDVMTNPGMSEPGKNVNDWDAGVPKGDAKPWSGYPSKKNKADKPFNAGKGKQVEENFDLDDTMSDMDIEECGDIEQMEEGAARFGHVQKHTKSKKHIGTNPFEKRHLKVQHSNSNAEDGYKADNQDVNEAILMKANKIFAENKKLKNYLSKFKNVLQEAAVTNVSLGNIIKLISENATSKDEKQEIITRFGKECKTVEDSNKLYESISNDLKKKEKLNISESKQYSVEDSNKINETKIYMSNDLKDSLDLMHRLCK